MKKHLFLSVPSSIEKFDVNDAVWHNDLIAGRNMNIHDYNLGVLSNVVDDIENEKVPYDSLHATLIIDGEKNDRMIHHFVSQLMKIDPDCTIDYIETKRGDLGKKAQLLLKTVYNSVSHEEIYMDVRYMTSCTSAICFMLLLRLVTEKNCVRKTFCGNEFRPSLAFNSRNISGMNDTCVAIINTGLPLEYIQYICAYFSDCLFRRNIGNLKEAILHDIARRNKQ